MPSSYALSLIVAVALVVAARLLLPAPARAPHAGWSDAVLVLLGGLGLTFHCGAMFYRSTVVRIPGARGLVDAVNAMSTASMVAYAIPAAVLLIGLRRARPVLLALVIAGLTAVGVTMYNGSRLDTHLTTIVVAAALIALTVADTFTTRARGRGARSARSPIATSSCIAARTPRRRARSPGGGGCGMSRPVSDVETEWTSRWLSGKVCRMDLGDVLQRLEPLQQRAVAMVYFEGRSPTEAAGLLAVERAVIAAALTVAFRRIARWLLDEDDVTTFSANSINVTRWRAPAT